MTYEEYTQLDRDSQVRACLNDLALVAAGQSAIPDVDDRAETPLTVTIAAPKTRLRMTELQTGIDALYKIVGVETGTDESTVRRIVEAYEEIEALRRS